MTLRRAPHDGGREWCRRAHQRALVWKCRLAISDLMAGPFSLRMDSSTRLAEARDPVGRVRGRMATEVRHKKFDIRSRVRAKFVDTSLHTDVPQRFTSPKTPRGGGNPPPPFPRLVAFSSPKRMHDKALRVMRAAARLRISCGEQLRVSWTHQENRPPIAISDLALSTIAISSCQLRPVGRLPRSRTRAGTGI